MDLVKLSNSLIHVVFVAIPFMKTALMRLGGTTSFGSVAVLVINLGSLSM